MGLNNLKTEEGSFKRADNSIGKNNSELRVLSYSN
jgi:hypothetical protein